MAGCASESTAIAETLRFFRGGQDYAAAKSLDPHLRYLRIVKGKRTALLVLGYVDAPSDAHPVETWYSAEGEVIKLKDGRIIGTTGLTTDWREVRLPPLPSWQSVSTQVITYTRERDEMPGYRMNVRETMRLARLPTYAPQSLDGSREDLQWFEESVQDPGNGAPLPASHYALQVIEGQSQIVYAEQCLTAALCFSWQRWPPAAANDKH
jgi:hypothetical protein